MIGGAKARDRQMVVAMKQSQAVLSSSSSSSGTKKSGQIIIRSAVLAICLVATVLFILSLQLTFKLHSEDSTAGVVHKSLR